MKKIKTLSAAIVLFAVVSCSKSKNDVPPPVVSGDKQLKEAVYTSTNGSMYKETMTYDVKGNLKSYEDDGHTYVFLYESANSLKIERKKTGEASNDQEIACTINEKGAITKAVYRSMPANTIAYTYEYTYDGNGYMTAVKGYDSPLSTFEEIFEIVNGNAVSSKVYHDGVFYGNRYYSYDQAIANPTHFSHWFNWPSKTLFGKPSKNLMTEYKSLNQSGVLNWHQKFSYQFDNAGYPSKMTIDYIHNGKQSSVKYLFQ